MGFRSQWMGFNGAPQTYYIGGYTAINHNKMGLGGSLFYDDKGGAINQVGAMVNYAYFVKLNQRDSKLAFGIAAIINQYTYDGADILALSNNDVALFGKYKSLAPDFNLGLVYSVNSKLKFGFAANQVLEHKLPKWNSYTLNAENRLDRHYHLSGSYLFEINKKTSLESYILGRTTFQIPVQFELGTRIILNNSFNIGAAYRHLDAILFICGYQYKNMFFGYSYDASLSTIREYSSGSHEIHIGYTFKSKLNQESKLD